MPMLVIPACPGCCDPCALGPELEALFSGVIDCIPGSCWTIAGTGTSYRVNSFSLAGPYTLALSSPHNWSGTGGSYNIDKYASEDCSGAPVNYTGAFDIVYTCSVVDIDDSAMSAFAVLGSDTIFAFQGNGALDTAAPNAAVCGVNAFIFGDGTDTISRP